MPEMHVLTHAASCSLPIVDTDVAVYDDSPNDTLQKGLAFTVVNDCGISIVQVAWTWAG